MSAGPEGPSNNQFNTMSFLWAAQYDRAIETIDLHTEQTVPDALQQLDHELFIFYNRRVAVCRIVYGIGTGVLRSAVLAAIRQHPFIEEWMEEDGGGSALIRLHLSYT